MAMNYARFEGPHAKPHANTWLHSEVYGSAFYGHITASTPTGPSSNPATAVVAQKEVLRNAVVAVQKGFGWGCGSDCTKGMRLGQWSPLHKSLQNTWIGFVAFWVLVAPVTGTEMILQYSDARELMHPPMLGYKLGHAWESQKVEQGNGLITSARPGYGRGYVAKLPPSRSVDPYTQLPESNFKLSSAMIVR